jgi:hypothetical protein
MLDRFAAERRSMTTAATTTPDAMAIHSTRRSFALSARTAPKTIGAKPNRIDRRRVTLGNMAGPGSPDYGEGRATPTTVASRFNTRSSMTIGCPSLQTAMRTASPLFS